MMAAIALDTSGEVVSRVTPDNPLPGFYHRYPDLWGTRWDQLPNDFVRGYTEAALKDLAERLAKMFEPHNRSKAPDFARFSNLSPEALAAILADCAARMSDQPRMGDKAHDGALFWADRQAGIAHDFPPLTVSLGDDGKVRLS